MDVLRVGARCPLGLNALQVATAARAQKLEPRSSALLDRRDNRIGTVRARWLPDDLHGPERMLALSAPALREAARGLRTPLPLLLGLPELARPDHDPARALSLPGEIAALAGVAIDEHSSRALAAGHASFSLVLEAAGDLIARGAPAVLVGAVDSYFDPAVLAWLDEARRLHAPGTENGIVPGEGAAFAVVASPAARGSSSSGGFLDIAYASAPDTLATLPHIENARDESSHEPEAPVLARVMTDLVGRACEALGGEVGWVVSDLNGEHHRSGEWSKVALRRREMKAARHDRLPALLGDVGAASGALGLALSCTYWGMGCAPSPSALFALHSEGPERATFLARASR